MPWKRSKGPKGGVGGLIFFIFLQWRHQLIFKSKRGVSKSEQNEKKCYFFQWKPRSAELWRPETFTNVKVVKVFPLPPSLSAFVDDISTKFLIISFLVEKLSQKVAAAAAVLFSNVHLLGSAPWLLNQRYLDLSPYRRRDNSHAIDIFLIWTY